MKGFGPKTLLRLFCYIALSILFFGFLLNKSRNNSGKIWDRVESSGHNIKMQQLDRHARQFSNQSYKDYTTKETMLLRTSVAVGEGRSMNSSKDKKNLYIYRGGGARLGNTLYWFGSTYGIARRHGRKTLWGYAMKAHLFKLFPGIKAHMVFADRPDWDRLWAGPTDYKPDVMKSIPEKNLTLGWYTHSYRYFNHCSDELYQLMTLDESLVAKAQGFINQCRTDYIKAHPRVDADKVSVVGVHVRRADKLRVEAYRIPEASEILYAMDYMRHKHNHTVLFVIATDDKTWCRETIQKTTDSFVTPFSSQYDDFTTLASCDHHIMTQSTFAFFAAWLMEQRILHISNYTKHPDILFYKYPFFNNTRLGRNYVRENSYPEHWMAYTNHSIDTQHQVLCDSFDVKSCF